jgi:hypothetical protein
MLETIRQACQSYYDQIPRDTFQTVAKSALFSFTASWSVKPLTRSYDLSDPLLNTGMATLAALIYALTTPLFNKIFGDNRILLHREMMKGIVTMVIMATTVTYFTTNKVSLVGKLVFSHMLPQNLFGAILDLIPMCYEWAGARQLANDTREFYGWFGMRVQPGSGSIYLVL